jgi:cytochrome c oxidase subunit 2
VLTRGIFIVATTLALTGCGREDALDPASPQQHRIVNLFWGMTAGSAIGFAVILGLLALGWRRRSREGLPFGGDEATATKLVVILGIAVPIVVLSALFVWSDVFVMNATSAPDPKTTKLTVEVVGHQFWWEARYPGSRAVTANEIHIPSGTRVNVVVTTADVIHSFWIPQLNRKIDMIPGKQNRIVLEADRPGRYRGQCYEFCGLQHAHMGMVVVAQPPAQFRAWLANMAKDARPPVSGDASRGRSVFLQQACSGCHQIRGTRAHASVGPDLTHLETRQTIAGVELPNTHAALERWVRDPQHEKPGVRMPALPLSDADAKAVVDYLESLR